MLHSHEKTPRIFFADVLAVKNAQQQAFAVLSDEEKLKYLSYGSRSAALTYLTARSFLRGILANELSVSPKEISFAAAEHGKPFIGGLRGISYKTNAAYNGNIEFNISHSGAYVVVALADYPVGVDIEQICRGIDRPLILRRFFSKLENESFNAAVAAEKDERLVFARGWTRKEALLKATGQGLSDVSSFEVSFEADYTNAVLTYRGSKELAKGWRCEPIPAADGYIGSLAWQINK